MTRHIIRISLVMLLGVVTSVAVAWVNTARARTATSRILDTRVDPVVGSPTTMPITQTIEIDMRCPSSGGWPFAALHARQYDSVGERYQPAPDWKRGIAIEIADATVRLPLMPIYPGLLANTAIYGSAWWAMLFGPGMFIRWRRRCAGRCAKCGYDLRGSAPGSACPECGHGGDTVRG